MYLAQSFIHSLVAALIVDTALLSWNIANPRVRQRYRLTVIVLSLVTFPLFQAIDPSRGTAFFRLDAFFDINRWLNLEIWGTIPLGTVFLLLLGFTGAVFLFQELLPIFRHAAAAKQGEFETTRPGPSSAVDRALAGIPGEKPDVFLLDDQEVLLFSSTGRSPAVYLSKAAVDTLTEEELRAAIAHEIGHIRRSRRPVMIMVFLLRVVMFLNPVILMEFRRFVQEEERICDDIAVELTGSREAMAGALTKLYAGVDAGGVPEEQGASPVRDRIEEYSHALLIESRIERLENPPALEASSSVIFGLVFVTIMGICYYVV